MSSRGKLGGVTRLVLAAGTVGVLAALLVLPGVGGTGLLLQKTADELTPVELTEPELAQRTRILDAHGKLITSFYEENRTDVTIDKIAPVLRQAIVAIEDARFYEHRAIDPKGTLRALVNNQNGGSVQGGSTITQQYVKNVLVERAARDLVRAEQAYSSATGAAAKKKAKAAVDAAAKERKQATEVSLDRKVKELRYAFWVEENYTKDEILNKYLNIAYFGNQTYGIEAAAERYFGVHASRLSLTQAATLAGMVNNANAYDPILHPKAAKTRRNTVLAKMAELGVITPAQANAGKAAGLGLHPKKVKGSCESSRFGAFCTYVEREILSNKVFGSTATARRDLLRAGGLTIRTTLNPKVQRAVDKAVRAHSPTTSRRVTMEAMVEPGTGAIQAISQSQPFGTGRNQTSIVYAADQAHGGAAGVQAGSTFKVFTLAAALQAGMTEGKRYSTPTSMTLSGFTDCSGNSLGSWDVSNAEKSGGSQDLASATWHSTNTYYAQLEREVGLCNVMKLAADLGMRAPDGGPLKAVPSYTLGADEIDLIHLSAAYAAFAAHGRYCAPTAITSVTDAGGDAMSVPTSDCTQALPAETADEVTRILTGVLTKGTAKGFAIPGRVSAGKTGTTENENTALFAGYTEKHAAVVWYGNPSAPVGDPVHAFGVSVAPVWRSSILAADAVS